jgi:predicted exporter
MKNLIDTLRDLLVGMIVSLPFIISIIIMALLFKYCPYTLWIFVFIGLMFAFIEVGKGFCKK